MTLSEETKNEIEEVNQLLTKINYRCAGMDEKTINFFSNYANIQLAKHLAAQQISQQSIPIANVEIDGEKIIPVDKKIVTLLEISSYYNVSVEYLAKEYEKCEYDQTNESFKRLMSYLKEYRKSCVVISNFVPIPNNSLGITAPLGYNSLKNNDKERKTLVDVARENNISFIRLYEEFLRYEDVALALQTVKRDEMEKTMIDKYIRVVDLSAGIQFGDFQKYFSYLRDRDEICRKLFSIEPDYAHGAYIDSLDFEKMLLIDSRDNVDMQFLITPDEMEFINKLRNKLMHGQICLNFEELTAFLTIVTTRRLSIYENTKQLKKIIEREFELGINSSNENTDSFEENNSEVRRK